METAEPVRRTTEIEDLTNLYFIHPVANRLTLLLAAMRVRPNAVSLAGMLCGILAGIAYAHYRHPRYAVAGFILMIAWHVMDGADGQLARLTHTQSQSGKVLDGLCDYVTFIAVYVALALALSRQDGNWVWGLIAVSGLCHAAQSASYEAQRQDYDFWGWGRASVNHLARNAEPRSRARKIADRLHQLYARIQGQLAGDIIGYQGKLAAIVQRDPEHAPLIRARYRKVFAPAVRRWSVLSANTRSLGIFICALFQAPLYFFWFEIFGLGLIWFFLLSRQAARYARFFRQLGIS